MKIALVASAGGHLTEIQTIITKEMIKNNEVIFLTERSLRTERLKEKTYFFKQLLYNPMEYIFPLIRCIKIFKKEKVKLIITTGAQVGLLALIAGKILRIKTVYIDTAAVINAPALAGKFSYLFSDIFLVHYPKMAKCYGKRAKYVGSLL